MECTEVWKNVIGFEEIYQISSFGNLKSFKKNKDGIILKQTNKKGGYFSVVLIFNNKIKYTRIHRLVAESFILNPENKKHVNHIDGNKQNNNVSNLEWNTPKENTNHAISLNPNIIKGIRNYNQNIRPKKIIQKDLNETIIDVFNNAKEASDKTGVCQRNILQVANKTEYKPSIFRKQAGGFKWSFL